jgi:hypothetical protein
MGINLTTIKHDAFARRPAKTRYSNGWLSFENQACDLLSKPGAMPLFQVIGLEPLRHRLQPTPTPTSNLLQDVVKTSGT